MGLRDLAWQLVQVSVLPGRLLSHASFGGRNRQRLLFVHQRHKHSYLFISDHLIPLMFNTSPISSCRQHYLNR